MKRVVFLIAIIGVLIPFIASGQIVLPLIRNFGSTTDGAKWNRTDIEVCWENPTSNDTEWREVVRKAADESWGSISKLRFLKWNTCEQKAPGIHIRIADTGPHVKALGQYLDARPSGMVLNFDFKNWSKSCQLKKEFCVSAIAVHEFGHAIGFAHEHNRSDAPLECQLEKQGTDGTVFLTEYDPDSVMNYCNPKWNGDGKLSKLDIASVNILYPR